MEKVLTDRVTPAVINTLKVFGIWFRSRRALFARGKLVTA